MFQIDPNNKKGKKIKAIDLPKKQMCANVYNSERVLYLMNNCNCEGV